MADRASTIYNVTQFGVNVDTDDLHAPTGAWRQTQNIHRLSDSIISRKGLTPFNNVELTGSVLGGIALPTFDLAVGTLNVFLGFGETI